MGLQFVYARTLGEDDGARDAVFLSGNGPLVSVLQHALGHKVFVQGVHDFLKQYGAHRKRLPEEHIWVYDEAQRAWDAQQVLEKRGHATSEPEDFLRLGAQMPGWAMLVGLIGEGQEIYIGEEGGLAGWNAALEDSDKSWILHPPEDHPPVPERRAGGEQRRAGSHGVAALASGRGPVPLGACPAGWRRGRSKRAH
ncbi:DNA/RNA helicase domain-containing protein [Deinococcus radiopugnans]|uniref:DNA/RNA helicase domain-containing protein n=1 Tax=Deinococcus radiopugnans TaxID=57497 RepID=UPI003607ABF6